MMQLHGPILLLLSIPFLDRFSGGGGVLFLAGVRPIDGESGVEHSESLIGVALQFVGVFDGGPRFGDGSLQLAAEGVRGGIAGVDPFVGVLGGAFVAGYRAFVGDGYLGSGAEGVVEEDGEGYTVFGLEVVVDAFLLFLYVLSFVCFCCCVNGYNIVREVSMIRCISEIWRCFVFIE